MIFSPRDWMEWTVTTEVVFYKIWKREGQDRRKPSVPGTNLINRTVVGNTARMEIYLCIAHCIITIVYRRSYKLNIPFGRLNSSFPLSILISVLPTDNSTEVEDIDFNERFSWIGSYEMGESYREGLVRGLPFPILTVAEYFSLGQEGFAWGGQYRAAGYYAGILLWSVYTVHGKCLGTPEYLMARSTECYNRLLPRLIYICRITGFH